MPKWNSASNSEQLNMRHYMHNNISPLLKLYFHFPLIIWGELIKDMTNWLLLSENFIWLQIWVFILVEFSKCSTKTFSPELLSAFLGAFFSLSILIWNGIACVDISFHSLPLRAVDMAPLSIQLEKLCLTWLKCCYCQFSWGTKSRKKNKCSSVGIFYKRTMNWKSLTASKK